MRDYWRNRTSGHAWGVIGIDEKTITLVNPHNNNGSLKVKDSFLWKFLKDWRVSESDRKRIKFIAPAIFKVPKDYLMVKKDRPWELFLRQTKTRQSGASRWSD